jgi:signal transduction histidine kinase
MTTGQVAGRRGNLASPSHREPLASYLFTGFLAVVLTVALVTRGGEMRDLLTFPIGELVLWTGLLLTMNLVPFNDEQRSFSLDTPILVTIALLYPPGVAAAIAFVGSMDLREIQRRVSLPRAIFNRTQIALGVLSASFGYRIVAGEELDPWTWATLGTAVALVSFHLVNVVTVGIHTALRTHGNLHDAFAVLTVGPFRPFLATYFGYGVLGLVLAHLAVKVGLWSVALFLIPLFVARQMLVRGVALVRLTDELRRRERLLERLFDRIVEERRDERLRIATGLHDEVLQSLIRVQQVASFVRNELTDRQLPSQDADELVALTRQTIDDLRDVLQDLQRSPVGRGGLVPSLRALAGDLQIDWRTRVIIRADRNLDIPPEPQIVAYQIAREALINALKHAGASSVEVRVHRFDGELGVAIQDNGRGFDPGLVYESEGFGLGLMRARAQLAGGEFEVKSSQGTGTTISIRLPIGARQQSSSGVIGLPETTTEREHTVHPAPPV